MKTVAILRHEFVDFVPDKLENGVLYVSMQYATASHLCCCGCGKEVVTPFSPTDWRLVFDGKTISLEPSIGNWGFDCKSHYFIRQGRVAWANTWSDGHVAAGRAHDQKAKQHYYEDSPDKQPAPPSKPKKLGRWQRFKRWWRGAS